MVTFKKIYNCLLDDTKMQNNDFFWFMFCTESVLFNGELSPQDITRFIRLCCTTNYDNILSERNNKKIYKNDLPKVLQIKPTALNKTILALQQNGLIEIKDDIIYISKNYCVKGKVNETTDNQRSAICIYSNAFQTIYNQSTPSQHKTIGKILSLIPYMNTHNNIICEDTKTNDYDKCSPFTQSKLMQAIGLDYTHSSRFLKDSNQIRFMDMPLLIKRKSSKNGIYEFMLNPNVCCWSSKQQKTILQEMK